VVRDRRPVRREEARVVRRACAWSECSIARPADHNDQKMEHTFLTSGDHLTIEHAIRRAELLALGAADELVQAELATRLAADLGNGAFWHTVWTFLIANAGAIDLAQIGPMIDFIQAMRHERVAVETARGIVLRDPPDPSLSMKGRMVQSLLRLMQD
jgi:hypothetical protein